MAQCSACGDNLPEGVPSHDPCWIWEKIKVQEDLPVAERPQYLQIGNLPGDKEFEKKFPSPVYGYSDV